MLLFHTLPLNAAPIHLVASAPIASSDGASPDDTSSDRLIPAVPPSAADGEAATPEEAAIAQGMAAGIASHVRDTGKSGHAIRDAHPKAHGCVKARFRVLDGLPDRLRVGLFAEPRDYQAWIRFSNGSPTPQADQVDDARGMAIKVMGVAGSASTTQDFVMINGPAFFVRSVPDYVAFTTASPLWHFFVPSWNPFKIRWREFRNVRRITGETVLDPLDIRYWSETPYLFGPTPLSGTASLPGMASLAGTASLPGMASFKFSAKPVSTLETTVADGSTSPDRLREAMKLHLGERGAEFDFMAQPRTDPEAMSIEDSTIEWDERRAPFAPVARITVPPQDFDGPEQRIACDALSFTPWHGLAAHRPLGGINRVRRSIYEAVSRLRHGLNGAPDQEPTGF